MDCPFTFQVPPGTDKEKLPALSGAQLMYERMNEVRRFFGQNLAILSVWVWLSIGWPTRLSRDVWAFFLALWGTCCLVTFVVGIMDWGCRHRRARRFADHEAAAQKGAG